METKAKVRRLLLKRLGFSIPVRVPDEDEAGVPTAFCRQDRDYMNYQNDDIDVRGTINGVE